MRELSLEKKERKNFSFYQTHLFFFFAFIFCSPHSTSPGIHLFFHPFSFSKILFKKRNTCFPHYKNHTYAHNSLNVFNWISFQELRSYIMTVFKFSGCLFIHLFSKHLLRIYSCLALCSLLFPLFSDLFSFPFNYQLQGMSKVINLKNSREKIPFLATVRHSSFYSFS